MIKSPLLAAVFVLAAAAPQLAAAAPPAVSQMKVRISDLDLETPRGAREMLHRIRLAAVDVCGSPAGDNAYEVHRIEACYRDTVARSVAALNRPLVTAAAETPAPRRLYARR